MFCNVLLAISDTGGNSNWEFLGHILTECKDEDNKIGGHVEVTMKWLYSKCSNFWTNWCYFSYFFFSLKSLGEKKPTGQTRQLIRMRNNSKKKPLWINHSSSMTLNSELIKQKWILNPSRQFKDKIRKDWEQTETKLAKKKTNRSYDLSKLSSYRKPWEKIARSFSG